MRKLFQLLIIALSLVAADIAQSREINVTVSDFKGRGGRVGWAPNGAFAVFDRKGWDGGHDIYLTRDFKTEKCLTCNHPDLPNKQRKYGDLRCIRVDAISYSRQKNRNTVS